MLLVMPLSVDLSFAGNNTPESKLGIVCTPSWTLNTKKLEETNEPHIIVVCNTLVPILSWQIRLLVAKEKREMTVRIPEMKSLIFSIVEGPCLMLLLFLGKVCMSQRSLKANI